MIRLDQTQLFEIADRLYRYMNPDSKMCTPNTAYILTEKWYKEYEQSDSVLDFYEWCLKEKQVKQTVSINVVMTKDMALCMVKGTGGPGSYTFAETRYGRLDGFPNEHWVWNNEYLKSLTPLQLWKLYEEIEATKNDTTIKSDD